MSEMSKVEEVARAIYETEPYQISMQSEMPWADVHESQKEGFRVKARAAIAAMREPSEAMLFAYGTTSMGPDDDALAKSVWHPMIDAALKE